MADSLPYLVAPGTLTTALQKIKAAATPERFTHDFLANTLGMKGGTPRPVIPFFKRIGFLAGDGTPTELYKAFRNPAQSGVAVSKAMRIGYKALFDMNEQANQLSDGDLKGLIVQATGHEENSRAVQLTVATFKILKKHAVFDGVRTQQVKHEPSRREADTDEDDQSEGDSGTGIHLSYTINLNLPASPDIAVFNAIFKALRDNLLKK